MNNMNYRTLYTAITNKPPRAHVVVKWPWWYKGFTGFTLGPIIFVKDRRDKYTLIHELVHVKQFYKNPFTFWYKYLVELNKKGYRNNKYEKEAYKIEEEARKYGTITNNM